jgi:hypothetical protein
MARPDIPEKPADFTPEWLTRALRESGLLHDASVVEVDTELLGIGQGFIGDVIRLRLTFDREVRGAPPTLIVKLPTSRLSTNRGIGQMAGAYEREILFYRELGADAGPRTPKHYYSAMEEAPGSRYTAAFIRFFDRMPRWLIRLVIRFFVWLSRFGKRRYLLMLEDLAPARVGDQVEGCSREEAERALRAGAKLHARYWRSPLLWERWWIIPIDTGPNMAQVFFEDTREQFIERYKERLTDSTLAQLEWLRTYGPEVPRALASAPPTLLHGDFRLDNMFFDDATGDVLLFDWQGPLRGPAAFDVAYFLSAALSDASSEEEVELLRFYHGALREEGVRDYPFEEFERTYQLAMMLMLHRMSATVSDLLDLGEDRGLELIDTWISRILKRLEGVDPQPLLPAPLLSAPGRAR